jgi:hypothetical protein
VEYYTDIFILILVLVGTVVFFVWFFWGLYKAKGDSEDRA